MSTILILFIALTLSSMCQKTNKLVYEAYELRINGHADSAKVLLERVTKDNPENALAWYELCRTTQQLGMANPRVIKESLEEALRYINLAIENDHNNAWYLSYKGKIETLQFYLSMQMGDENAAMYLENLEKTYKSVFQIDPTFYEDKLTLVEFFSGLPPEMGGVPEKALKYTEELEAVDVISGAKARELIMPEDADYVAYWTKIIEEEPGNADALQALGRIYLLNQNINEATNYYQKVIDRDPSKNDLYLDLGRYYMMVAMQNPAILDSVAPFIEEQFNNYLNSTPEPTNTMKAWTISFLGLINRRTGNTEAADKYSAIAKELDPFSSPAFGKPSKAIYCPPDVVVHDHGYYLSPF